jgi:hypothetical protein
MHVHIYIYIDIIRDCNDSTNMPHIATTALYVLIIVNDNSTLEHMGVQLSRSDVRALMALYTSTSNDYDDVIR